MLMLVYGIQALRVDVTDILCVEHIIAIFFKSHKIQNSLSVLEISQR